MPNGRFDLFSPISASPLLSSHHQQQSPPSSGGRHLLSSPHKQQGPPSSGGHQETSISLISTHTIVDTPTRLDKGKKREGMRLNKAFCDESGQQVACSQELFGSPELPTQRGDDSTLVNSVPDSPILQTPPPDGNEQTSPVLKSPQSPESPTEETMVATEDIPAIIGTGCEQPKVTSSTNQPTTVSPPATVKDSSTACESFLPTYKESLSKRRCSTNTFLYPSSRRPSIRPCQAVQESCRDVKGVECSVQGLPRPPWLRSRRKRNASSSVAPPEKKILQSSSGQDGTGGPGGQEQESTTRDCSSQETSTHSSDTVQNGDLTSEENVAVTVECKVVQPVADVRESHAPELHGMSGSPLNQPHQQPVAAGPEHVPMECDYPSPPPPRPPQLVGFTTASGHSLQISTQGMRRARELMADSEDEVPTPVSNREDLASPAVVPPPDMSVAQPFTGFQTASGRSLSISEKALQKAHQFLSEDGEDQHSNIATPLTSKTKTHQSVHTPHLPPTPQSVPTDKKTALITPSCTLPPRGTLSTGKLRTRGTARQTKPFKAPRPANSVSKEEESAKIARLLHGMRRAGAGSDLVATPPALGGRETPSLATTSGVEFSTGSGRKLSISAASYQRAQQLVSEDKENGIATPDLGRPPPPLNWGFQSASGKRLKVSTQALEKAHSLFAGMDDESNSLFVPNEAAPEGHLPGPSAVHSDHQSYTGGELGQDDIDEFAAFTQVHFQGPGGQALTVDEGTDVGPLTPTTAVGGGGGKGEHTEREEEMDQEGDDYFSTQVVKQFLNFSADEEDNTQPVGSPSQIEPTPPSSSQGHPSIQHCSPEREDGEVLYHTDPLGGGPPISSIASGGTSGDDSSKHDKLAKETHTSFCQQTTSASLIDELFGIVDSEACPTDPAEVESAFHDGPSRVTEVEFLERGGVSEGGCSGGVRLDPKDGISAGIVESVATMEEVCGEQPGADSSVTTAEVETSSVEGAIADQHREEISVERENHGQDDTVGTSVVDTSERPCSGLMTASGRKITVSESALSAARAALYSSSPPPTTTHGTTAEPRDHLLLPIRAQLQTAGGRPVSISEESLKTVKFVLNTSHSPSSSSGSQQTTSPKATDEVTTCRDDQKHKLPSSFPGLQTASGRPVPVSEAALKAVRQADSTAPDREGSPDLQQQVATCTSTDDPGTSTDGEVNSQPSSVSGVAPRLTPHFRPLTTHKTLASSKLTVRYKPVFKSGQQTHPAPPPPSPILPTPSLTVSQPVTRALHSTPEG